MNTLRPPISHLPALFRKKPFTMPSPGPPLPPGILVDEEISPIYDSKYFYPARPGEVLADRYQTLVKVGWGVSSTVWLARDLQGHIEEPESVVALKIANNNASSAGHEREVKEHISTANPSHHGGSYSCLVYPPMRKPLSIYQWRFSNRKVPLPLIKAYIHALLTRFDYLHKECRIAHTDIKLENITVSFKDPTVLADFMDSQLEKPMAFKIDLTGQPVYQSHNDFRPLKSLRSIPQLINFSLATRLKEDNDWSNLSVLDMIKGKELFRHIHDQQGHYNAKLHIAEMIALFSPPVPEVLQRYQYMQEYSWPEPVRQEDNRVYKTAEEYFCGPFFNNNGGFLYKDLIPDWKLGDTIDFLKGEDREAFLDLTKGMLVWHPNARKTAGELAEHPFLQPKPTSA
ncbi:hypothetical protein ASPWEDRAFT_62631 [Aspergillus wentii DTO 134E9]|uniref:Protein kinase domain-containing protein n=1 Tax=Aspergillus wentii DTO 134E9 TaxID=1073089 RepID=A0A1L9R996_ASPWE|nr:uncharacterized protein ASPWEDRAFT_62631 [Aspergillus wentii DTO 134E9]OJJ31495.1 hypothetical protein ASPWEDRAFT_62631 [Aspergillus wentii DTO 134E9]